jgi:MFS family permease
MAHTVFIENAQRALTRERAPRVAVAIAYSVGALSIATALGAFALDLVAVGQPDNAHSADPSGLIISVTFAAAGAVVASRQSANPIGWLFLLSATVGAFGAASSDYLNREIVARGSAFAVPPMLRSFDEWAWVPGIVPVVAFVPMFFPNGRLLSTRWRPMPILAMFGSVAMIAAIAVSPTGDRNGATLGGPNPYAIDAFWVQPLLIAGFGLLLLAILLAIASLLLRLRRATPTERQQLKVLFYAAIIWPTALVGTALTGSIPFTSVAPLTPVFQALAVFGIVAIPVAVAIAILRYRLYDIDVLIRRTLIYGTLSVVLLVAYVTGLGLIQVALSPLTSGNGLAVAVSTLAVVALFQPVRGRIQSSVDRRFYRRKYDAVRTLDSFATRLREEIDLEALRDELIDAAGETVQPAHASLWLRDSRVPAFAGATRTRPG